MKYLIWIQSSDNSTIRMAVPRFVDETAADLLAAGIRQFLEPGERVLTEEFADAATLPAGWPVPASLVGPAGPAGSGAAITDLTAPSLLSPWTVNASNTPRYYKLGGIVFLEGWATGGTKDAAIFVLPVGFRPPARRLYLVPSWNGSADIACTLAVETTGEVGPVSAVGGSGNNVPLDGVCFRL